jgi:hypothetical protein
MRWLYAIVDTSNKLNETLDIRWTWEVSFTL